MLQLLVANHTVVATAVDFPVFCAPTQLLAAFRHGRAWCFATIACSHEIS